MLPGGGGDANYFNNIRNQLKDNVIFHAWKGGNEQTGLTTREKLLTEWNSYVNKYYEKVLDKNNELRDSEQLGYLKRRAENYKTMREARIQKRAEAEE